MFKRKVALITVCMMSLMGITSLADTNTNPTYPNLRNYDCNTFHSLEGGVWERVKGWAYTKPDGTAASGWTIIDGDYHYFDEDRGFMYIATTTPDGYYVDHNGVWITTPEDESIVVPGNYEFSYGWIYKNNKRTEIYSSDYSSTAAVQKIDDNNIILNLDGVNYELYKSDNKYLFKNKSGYVMNDQYGSFDVKDGENHYYYKLIEDALTY